MTLRRPNKDEAALLQARHLYNDAKIEKVIDGGGFTIGKDDVVIKVNRMAWGLFEATILKAFKQNEYLRQWSPDLVSEDKPCEKCNGVGGFPLTPGTKEYDDAYNDFYMFDGKLEEGAPPKEGWECSIFCSPCQGTGFVLKSQPPKG